MRVGKRESLQEGGARGRRGAVERVVSRMAAGRARPGMDSEGGEEEGEDAEAESRGRNLGSRLRSSARRLDARLRLSIASGETGPYTCGAFFSLAAASLPFTLSQAGGIPKEEWGGSPRQRSNVLKADCADADGVVRKWAPGRRAPWARKDSLWRLRKSGDAHSRKSAYLSV